MSWLVEIPDIQGEDLVFPTQASALREARNALMSGLTAIVRPL